MATGRVPTTANSPLTAKGDLFTYSTAPARLAVGNNGESLVADSAATTGLRYQSGYNGNAIINGGFDIWQRGTSFTAASVYTADRWFAGSQTTYTRSRQASGLTGIQYAMRVQRDSGSTNTNGGAIYYNLESADSYRFAGQTVTVSFYAKAGANYSATANALSYVVYTGTGTDQRRDQSTAFTGEVQAANSSVTLTTSYQRFQFTAAIGATATEINLAIYSSNTGTAGANDWFEITGVQLELGSVATSFKRSNGAGGNIQGELAACQRYYQRWSGNNEYIVGGYNDSTTVADYILPFEVQMRVAPTITAASGTNYFKLKGAGFDNGVTTITLSDSNINSFFFRLTSSGLTAGQGVLSYFGNASSYLEASGEL